LRSSCPSTQEKNESYLNDYFDYHPNALNWSRKTADVFSFFKFLSIITTKNNLTLERRKISLVACITRYSRVTDRHMPKPSTAFCIEARRWFTDAHDVYKVLRGTRRANGPRRPRRGGLRQPDEAKRKQDDTNAILSCDAGPAQGSQSQGRIQADKRGWDSG
jgi:hypothetical protein